jgi:hypothetical protein
MFNYSQKGFAMNSFSEWWAQQFDTLLSTYLSKRRNRHQTVLYGLPTIMHLRTEMFWGAVIAIALSVVITVIIGLITGVIE